MSNYKNTLVVFVDAIKGQYTNDFKVIPFLKPSSKMCTYLAAGPYLL